MTLAQTQNVERETRGSRRPGVICRALRNNYFLLAFECGISVENFIWQLLQRDSPEPRDPDTVTYSLAFVSPITAAAYNLGKSHIDTIDRLVRFKI